MGDEGWFYVIKSNWKIKRLWTRNYRIIQIVSKILNKLYNFGIKYSRLLKFIGDDIKESAFQV
jgi:hypothetical protein